MENRKWVTRILFVHMVKLRRAAFGHGMPCPY